MSKPHEPRSARKRRPAPWRLLRRWWATAVVALATWGCEATDYAESVCPAGATQQCFCSDGLTGAQRCESDGAEWGECECQICAPGETNTCTCAQGEGGVQVCDPLGESYLACECDDCPPDSSRECTCPEGEQGVQSCNARGTLWSGCECKICDAGATRDCVCPNGEAGEQTCADGGTGFGACSCRSCEPAASRSCSCPDGSTGEQLCNEMGSGYDACACPIDCSGAALPVWPTAQYCSEWCWTAVLTMVISYFGTTYNGLPPSECAFESDLTGYDCCQYTACSYQVCNQPAGSGQVIDYYLQLFGVYGYDLGPVPPGYLSEQALIAELDAGRPVIVGVQGYSISHVFVVSGYQSCGGVTYFHIIDPLFGEGDALYDVFFHYGPNGDGTWVESWYGLGI